MINYPITFNSEASSREGINSSWSVKSEQLSLNCSIPPQFEGPGQAWSPEDLYAQALTNCFIATFKVYAEKSKLSYNDIHAKGELVVDFDTNKKIVMKLFLLQVEIAQPSQKEKAIFLAEKALKNGFILNSVKTEILFKLNILD